MYVKVGEKSVYMHQDWMPFLRCTIHANLWHCMRQLAFFHIDLLKHYTVLGGIQWCKWGPFPCRAGIYYVMSFSKRTCLRIIQIC